MNIRYVHTNLIARDWKKLSAFYQQVFQCRPVPPERNLTGDWLDRLTGQRGAHITGEHLALPGYENSLPTLEIFSYEEAAPETERVLNRPGLAHLAFEVEDVPAALELVLQAGGSRLGDCVTANYPNGKVAAFVYARDPEGNILELQSWKDKSK